MPTVLDATVVNQPYDTSGNGGRKLVMLENGWLVAVVYATTPTVGFYIYKSQDNGETWQYVTKSSTNGAWAANDLSMVSKGNTIYLTSSDAQTGVKRWSLYVLNMEETLLDPLPAAPNVFDTNQTNTASYGTSLAINPEGTELHAVWSSRNSNYSNFNLRYVKGTINPDGSVTWNAVEEVTKENSTSIIIRNPSIVLDKDNVPQIFTEVVIGSSFSIRRLKQGLNPGTSYPWGALNNTNTIVYDDGSYPQSTPSAIFVPSEINGLPEGRIWVAWTGRDSSTYDGIYVSYSDNSGTTWSPAERLTDTANIARQFPSITANKKNEIHIIYNDKDSISQVKCIKYTNGTFGNPYSLTSRTAGNGNLNPSALFDLSVSYSSPLFIYSDSGKIVFYGSWTTTEISVPQGDLDEKTSKDNILTYAITTDNTMSTITEKVNGVVIGSKTAANGQILNVSLTQGQWDTLLYGKVNVLTVEMGGTVFTYTFRKLLSDASSIIETVKGVQAIESHLADVKSQLVAKIGGDAGMSFEDIIANGAYGRKMASGYGTASSFYLTVNGLGFKPSIVIARRPNIQNSTSHHAIFVNKELFSQPVLYDINFSQSSTSSSPSSYSGTAMTDDGFTMRVPDSYDYSWIAFE